MVWPVVQVFDNITSGISSICSGSSSLPFPINLINQGLSCLRVGNFVNNHINAEKNSAYFSGILINLTIGNQPAVSVASQIILVFRNVMKIVRSQSAVGKTYDNLASVISGTFPVPIRLLKSNTLCLDQSKTPYTELLNHSPESLADAILTVEKVSFCMDKFVQSLFACSWSYLELCFSIFIDKVTQFEATSNVGSNISEIFDALKDDPQQISREIDANAGLIDSIVPHINPAWKSKTISKFVTDVVLEAIKIQKKGSTVINSLGNTFQQSAFMFMNITTNTDIAPLGTNREGLADDHLYRTYPPRRDRETKLTPRFCTTD